MTIGRHHITEPPRTPMEYIEFFMGQHGRTTYAIKCGCCNCHHDFNMTLAKGTPVENAACPHCGCKTLISKENM